MVCEMWANNRQVASVIKWSYVETTRLVEVVGLWEYTSWPETESIDVKKE